jgi:hypothetical protein
MTKPLMPELEFAIARGATDQWGEVETMAMPATDLIRAKRILTPSATPPRTRDQNRSENVPSKRQTPEGCKEATSPVNPPPPIQVTFIEGKRPDSADHSPEPKSTMKANSRSHQPFDIETSIPPKIVEDAELSLWCLGEMVAAGTLSRFPSRRVTGRNRRDLSIG